MKQIWLFKYIVLVTFLFASFASLGQSYHRNRKEVKTFKVEKGTEVFIKNKYGNIQLIPWNKDSISFSISLEVEAKKEVKAEEIFKSIDFDFISSKLYVEAKTTFPDEGSIWADVKDQASSLFSSENNTQINYIVHLPSYLEIRIENKYGNIIMDDHQGSVSVQLSNGDLKAQRMEEASIDIQFGFANIKSINKGRVNLNYHSELRLDKAVDLTVESRSSRIQIDKVDVLKLRSNRDKCYLDEVKFLNATTSFSYLELVSLGEFITANCKYGDLEIRNLKETVNKIMLVVESTDISINRLANQSIEMDLVYDEKAGLYFTDELNNKVTEKEDGEEKLVRTIGVLGKSATPRIKLNATIRSGNIRINTK